LIKYSLLVLA